MTQSPALSHRWPGHCPIALAIVFWSLPANFHRTISLRRCRVLSRRLELRTIAAAFVPAARVFWHPSNLCGRGGMRICRLHVDHQVVLGTIPLVLLADGLPNFAGLGTRGTALQLLLEPEHPAVLLAMSLFWSAGLIIGRLSIALAHLWGTQLFTQADDLTVFPGRTTFKSSLRRTRHFTFLNDRILSRTSGTAAAQDPVD